MGMLFASKLGVRGADRMDDRRLFDLLYNLSSSFGHGSSSFPLITANVAHKAVLRGFEAARTTWRIFAAIGSLSDFKPHNRIRFSEQPALLKVNEGEPAPQGSYDEQQESIQCQSFARAVSWTFQLWKNEDTGTFQNRARSLGNASDRTIEKYVWDLFLMNLGAGPTMSDGNALFHTDHGNLAGTGAAPSQATLEAAMTRMSKQTDINSDPDTETPLGIMPAYALAGSTNAYEIEKIVGSLFSDSGATDARRRPQLQRVRNLEVVEVPTLTVRSENDWYLMADQDEAPSIEVGFLDGVQTPTTRVVDGGTVDGSTVVVRHYFDAAFTGGWQGVDRNPGQ